MASRADVEPSGCLFPRAEQARFRKDPWKRQNVRDDDQDVEKVARSDREQRRGSKPGVVAKQQNGRNQVVDRQGRFLAWDERRHSRQVDSREGSDQGEAKS